VLCRILAELGNALGALPREAARCSSSSAIAERAAFAAAWAEGRAMTLEQAVAYALEEHSSA
jgi:hypothetical protein